jgi:oligosaccharyltransferase complex subunit alpha (ribophorin I)
MKFSALLPALASCLSLVSAASTTTSKVNLPATFKPPQVFKNANLVHILQLEKNYAKELINVKIENTAKEPQDQYFLPFTPDQMSRVGGFEVKDKKNTEAGPFTVEAVDFDPER